MAEKELTGKVVEVDVSGVGVIEDETSHGMFVFTFDKVKGYFGQSRTPPGLKPGTRVNFRADDRQVKYVEAVNP